MMDFKQILHTICKRALCKYGKIRIEIRKIIGRLAIARIYTIIKTDLGRKDRSQITGIIKST